MNERLTGIATPGGGIPGATADITPETPVNDATGTPAFVVTGLVMTMGRFAIVGSPPTPGSDATPGIAPDNPATEGKVMTLVKLVTDNFAANTLNPKGIT